MSRTHRPALWVLIAIVAVTAAACSKNETSPATAGTTTGAGMSIDFKTASNPPTSGDNPVEVVVMKDGKPVTDATVTAVFTMPAMPSMNMPEMKNTTTLDPQGGGRYAGVGQMSMAGTWNVLIKVARGSDELGTHSLSIVAK